MDFDLVVQMQVDIMQGKSWDGRNPAFPDTPEAREAWNEIAADIKQAEAQGLAIDIPFEL